MIPSGHSHMTATDARTKLHGLAERIRRKVAGHYAA
jgi:hypothetical protein